MSEQIIAITSHYSPAMSALKWVSGECEPTHEALTLHAAQRVVEHDRAYKENYY